MDQMAGLLVEQARFGLRMDRAKHAQGRLRQVRCKERRGRRIRRRLEREEWEGKDGKEDSRGNGGERDRSKGG